MINMKNDKDQEQAFNLVSNYLSPFESNNYHLFENALKWILREKDKGEG